MNLFNYDIGRKLLIAEGWCPKTSTEDIVKAMKIATEKNGGTIPSVLSVVDTHEEPPTHFKTNKFTSSYLAIVEAYGVAQYGEVNPAAITIITFPFLFAVMFGDFGHGLLMTIFASFLIYKEKQFSGIQLNEMIKTCFDGRYVLILMGLFSMYTGKIIRNLIKQKQFHCLLRHQVLQQTMELLLFDYLMLTLYFRIALQ